MPTVETVQFGSIDYEKDTEILFPSGLPAFESERLFVFLHRPESDPLLFLQSLSRPDLMFLVVAVQNIVLDYQIELTHEDQEALGGPGETADFDVVALLTVTPTGDISANLQGPVVIHRERRRAVQSIQPNPALSCRHPLGPVSADPQEPSCS